MSTSVLRRVSICDRNDCNRVPLSDLQAVMHVLVTSFACASSVGPSISEYMRGAMAQRLEHRTLNGENPGSNPLAAE